MLLAVLGVAPAVPAIDLHPVIGGDWIPGDCDQSGRVDLGDAVRTIKYLFFGNVEAGCAPLCDANGDARVDAGDPVHLLNFLFVSSLVGPYVHDPSEICDGRDNDCDAIVDEDCAPMPLASVSLTWDPVSEDVRGKPELVWGYRVHFGTTPGMYPFVRHVREANDYDVDGLLEDQLYYFAVSAVDRSGNESGLSQRISARATRRRQQGGMIGK